MSVVLAGGGSAGHIEPALAPADALRRADPRIQITCLGTERGLETRLVPLRGYDLALIPAVPLPRSLSADLLSVPGRLARRGRPRGRRAGRPPGRGGRRIRRLRGHARLSRRPAPPRSDRGA